MDKYEIVMNVLITKNSKEEILSFKNWINNFIIIKNYVFIYFWNV